MKNESILLPLDCVIDFLKKHPLMLRSKAQLHGVYDAIVEMLQHARQQTAHGEDKAQPSKKSRVEPCALCKGVQLYDSHRGELVCSSCGVCSRYTAEADSQLYDKRDEEFAKGQKKDVQSWAKKSVEFADGEYRRIVIDKDVDSWNNYHVGGPNHGQDTLARLKILVHVPTRVGPMERVVGALLLPAIEQAFDLDKVADAVRNGKRLPTLEYEEPTPEFTCLKCGAPVFNKYEERRHPCSWGKKTRRPAHLR